MNETISWQDFAVPSPFGGKVYRCRFRALATGISPRGTDTADVEFLVDGAQVVVALPHAAFAEYRQETGRLLTDQDAVRIAGFFLKQRLERGEWPDSQMLTLSSQQTLEMAHQAESAVQIPSESTH